MVLPSCFRNIDSASSNDVTSTSSHLHEKPSTTSTLTLFRSDPPPLHFSNLFKSNLPLLNYEKTDEKPVGEFLWQRVCCHMDIKDFSPKQASFCKYTWEIVAYMIITGKKHLGLDIWPGTLNQDISTKDMISTTQFKEVIKQKKINPQQQHPLSPSLRKVGYTSYISSNLKNSYTNLFINT